jgi:hypothetical protein
MSSAPMVVVRLVLVRYVSFALVEIPLSLNLSPPVNEECNDSNTTKYTSNPILAGLPRLPQLKLVLLPARGQPGGNRKLLC